MRAHSLWFLAACAIFSVLLQGCGYHFQKTRNPLVDLGIRKIYVSVFRNQTFRPGVEHYFTNAMIREIERSRSFELVNNEAAADAVLKGQISQTDSSINATKNIPRITSGLDRDVDVATEYKASINCDINLVDRHGRLIFSQTMGGEKVHLGAAQTGDAGATAPLINDSEHRMAIQFLAAQMMASVYQRMVDTF